MQGVPGDREVMGDGEAGREGELEGVLDAEAPWGSELEGVLEEETPRGREVGVPVEVPEAVFVRGPVEVPEAVCVWVGVPVEVPETVPVEEPLVDKEADALTVVDAVLMAELDSVALWEGEPLPPVELRAILGETEEVAEVHIVPFACESVPQLEDVTLEV